MKNRKCSMCGGIVCYTADKEPYCEPCGWIESKKEYPTIPNKKEE